MVLEAQDFAMESKDLSNIVKGKRTKRQRTVSPLRLAMTSSSSCAGESVGERERMTPSSCTSIDFADSTTGGEEEDMANCLILLAQGSQKTSRRLPGLGLSSDIFQSYTDKYKRLSETPAAKAAGGSALGCVVYRCKTCDRVFPSFQALGGHRASHKKPNNKIGNEGKKGIIEEYDHDQELLSNTSTTLSLQLSNRGNTVKANKVHECSICGAEFSSGQALGGHMRRHRAVFSSSSTTSATPNNITAAISLGGSGPDQSQESKKPRNSLQLDLNLPAPEDEVKESKFQFSSKEQVLVFSSASSLVDCHY